MKRENITNDHSHACTLIMKRDAIEFYKDSMVPGKETIKCQ